MFFAAALLIPLFLVSAGVIGVGGALFATGLGLLNVYKWSVRVEQASNQREFDQASAAAALSALSTLAFAAIGVQSFGYISQIGGFSAIRAVQAIGAIFSYFLGSLFDFTDKK